MSEVKKKDGRGGYRPGSGSKPGVKRGKYITKEERAMMKEHAQAIKEFTATSAMEIVNNCRELIEQRLTPAASKAEELIEKNIKNKTVVLERVNAKLEDPFVIDDPKQLQHYLGISDKLVKEIKKLSEEIDMQIDDRRQQAFDNSQRLMETLARYYALEIQKDAKKYTDDKKVEVAYAKANAPAPTYIVQPPQLEGGKKE